MDAQEILEKAHLMDAQEILEKAQDIILRDGWNQGSYARRGSEQSYDVAMRTAPVCVMGAIHRAMTGKANTHGEGYAPAYGVATRRLYEVIRRLYEAGDEDGITSWNDSDERTVEDVLLALKRAAEEA